MQPTSFAPQVPAVANARTRTIERAGFALLAIALLLPVGDAPWYSFWREWTAAIAVLLVVLGAVSTLRDLALPLRVRLLSLPALALGLASWCWGQHAIGLVPSLSDALLPSLYLVGFAICWIVAASLPAAQRDALADRLAAALLVAALLSAPLAISQWLGWSTLDLGTARGRRAPGRAHGAGQPAVLAADPGRCSAPGA